MGAGRWINRSTYLPRPDFPLSHTDPYLSAPPQRVEPCERVAEALAQGTVAYAACGRAVVLCGAEADRERERERGDRRGEACPRALARASSAVPCAGSRGGVWVCRVVSQGRKGGVAAAGGGALRAIQFHPRAYLLLVVFFSPLLCFLRHRIFLFSLCASVCRLSPATTPPHIHTHTPTTHYFAMSYQQPAQSYYTQPPPPQGQYMAPQQPVSSGPDSKESTWTREKSSLLMLPN